MHDATVETGLTGAVFAGVDWASVDHAVCVIDAAGDEKVTTYTILHRFGEGHLGGIRHREDDDVALRCGVLVRHAQDVTAALRGQLPCGLDGPRFGARADQDAIAGLRPAGGETGSLVPCAAQDGDRRSNVFRHEHSRFF